MFAMAKHVGASSLAQNKGVLRTNSDNESGAQAEPLK